MSEDSRAQLRTALVVLHMVAITLMAFPAPAGGMSRSAWKTPTVQAEFATWRERLASVGIERTPEEFEDQLWSFSEGLMAGRSRVLAPFDPYYRYCGTWQSWRMFVAPHTFPSNLHIDVMRGGEWETVYVGRSQTHTWMQDIFDHDRMRAAVFRYAWTRYGTTYKSFATWIAKRAAQDFPDADKVRVRYHRIQTPSASQTLAGEEPDGKFMLGRVFKLENFR